MLACISLSVVGGKERKSERAKGKKKFTHTHLRQRELKGKKKSENNIFSPRILYSQS
jgi:hypothetical protein